MIIAKIKKAYNNYFSYGHERTIRAKKNIAASFMIRVLSLLIGFILIPLTIRYVNPLQYGIWLTLGSIINWFNFFDIGLGSGLKNKIAEVNSLDNRSEAKIYVSTTYAILIIISLLLFAIFYCANSYLNWASILNIRDNNVNVNTIALVVFGGFCLQFVFQIINIVLTACHEVSKVSLISFWGQLLTLVVIYILTKCTTGSLLYLIITLTGAPILLQLIASLWYYKNKYSYLAPNFSSIQLKHAINLLSLGGSFLVIQIGGLILFQTDNIIVVKIFGPQVVTNYNIAYKLFSTVTMLFTIIMMPFWAAFTEAYAKNDYKWIENTFKKMYKYWIILVVVSALLLIISPFVYKIWLNKTVSPPLFSLSCAMALYVIGYCWLMIHCFLLNGIGKIRLQLYLYIISTIINIPIAIVLAKWFGVSGITYSNIFVFIYMGVILFIQCKKIINKTATGIWNK